MGCRAQLAVSLLALVAFCIPCEAADDAASRDSSAKQISLSEYEQELARIDRALKALPEHPEGASILRSSIAGQWRVQTSSETFEISNEDLRFELQRYVNDSEDRAEVLPELELKVEAQLDDAKSYRRPLDSSARAKLDSILAGREYQNVAKSQSPLEKLKDRALNWLIRLLRRFFEAAAAHPRVSRVLLWTVIGLVTLGFVVWLYFLLRRTTRDEYAYPRDGEVWAPSYKRWQQWVIEAREAGERGDWREAIHLAYWGAISYLESSGTWKPDRARTPREYLRMLPEVSERREPLTALTRRFEVTWYAYQPATATDFEFSLSQLEKIGCR